MHVEGSHVQRNNITGKFRTETCGLVTDQTRWSRTSFKLNPNYSVGSINDRHEMNQIDSKTALSLHIEMSAMFPTSSTIHTRP